MAVSSVAQCCFAYLPVLFANVRSPMSTNNVVGSSRIAQKYLESIQNQSEGSGTGTVRDNIVLNAGKVVAATAQHKILLFLIAIQVGDHTAAYSHSHEAVGQCRAVDSGGGADRVRFVALRWQCEFNRHR